MASAWNQTANSKGKDGSEGFERPPVGNHPAVLVALIDMGHQEHEYQGKMTNPHRAFFAWELVGASVSGTTGRNHVIGIDLTVSLNEKAKLRQWIESRVGKKMPDDAQYDISKELGQKCLLDVIANKKGYPVVNGMKSVPKGLAFPDHQNKPIAITLDDFRAGEEIPDWIPYLYGEPLSDVIRRCQELSGKKPTTATDDELAAGMEGRAVEADETIPY